MVSPRHGRRARGFTLVELMITMAAIAALAAIAAPSVKELVAKQRVRSATGDLTNTLMRTRSFAVKVRANVTMTPANAAKWELGWTVPRPAVTDGSLFDARSAIAQVKIKGPASVVYRSNGRPVTPATAQFEISGDGTTEVRCVLLDLTGLPYQKKSACT